MRLEPLHATDLDDIEDGRRRKGELRRRRLLEATLEVIASDGVAGVTQRAVAKQADQPPAAVLYYFDSVDELLSATLTMVNTTYVDQLSSIAEDVDPVRLIAELVASCADQSRRFAVAECELYAQAARNPDQRAELVRWWEALDAALRPVVADPLTRRALVATVDGLFMQVAVRGEPQGVDEIHEVLSSIAFTRR